MATVAVLRTLGKRAIDGIPSLGSTKGETPVELVVRRSKIALDGSAFRTTMSAR